MSCPNCGYCKHCGRSATHPSGWPYYGQPIYISPYRQPWYTEPHITWTGGTQTISAGGGATGNTVTITPTDLQNASWTGNNQ